MLYVFFILTLKSTSKISFSINLLKATVLVKQTASLQQGPSGT